MRVGFLVVVLFVVALAAYVRLAPSDTGRWHVVVEGDSNADFPTGARRVLPSSQEQFEKADAYLRALPKTKVLAGSVSEGRLTYVTRTRLMGFPDYTTIELVGDQLKLFARSRFGNSDLGVNSKRLQGLIDALQ